jgi:nucleotide-binding universal stress UspA family protein
MRTERARDDVTVGFDGSIESRRAIAWGADEAHRRLAPLHIVACHVNPVVENPWVPSAAYDESDAIASVKLDLEGFAADIHRRYPDLRCEQRLVVGDARVELVTAAAESALLVVGTSGAGAAESFLLGSVAHAVARTSPCPVVLVPGNEPSETTGRIVVATDGSRAATAAVVWATDEADRRDAELVVLHAWSYPYDTFVDGGEARDLTRVDAALVVDAAVERATGRGRSPVRARLVEGQPSAVIVDESAHADLVVVGSRGRGGFRSLLFGSVAHAVAAHAPCPTVVVRGTAADDPDQVGG